MDKHYLSYLFTPKSIAVFTGAPRDGQGIDYSQALTEALGAQVFKGVVQYLDIYSPDTVLELGQVQAELAVLAVPPSDMLGALEMALACLPETTSNLTTACSLSALLSAGA